MKRLLAGFIGVVLTAGVACAQAPFSDVPRDHWAYDAVNTLAQRGLVIGYPDGIFGGKRAMTRYEFAVVIARMLPQLEQYIQSEVAKATGNIKPPTDNGTPPELPTDLVRRSDLAGYATKGDVDALRRLIDEFGPELRLLRVDVDLLKKGLADLTDRVTVLEKEVARVKITGDMSLIARMSNTDSDTLDKGFAVFDQDGRDLTPSNNLLEWSQMMYNLNLGISGRVTDTIKANTILTVGNYNSYAAAPFSAGADVPAVLGQDVFPWGSMTSGGSAAEFGVYKAYVEAPILGAQAEVGRTGVQFTPLTLKQVDYDLYSDLPHLDNGDVIFNGAKASFKLGPVSVLGYAGTHGTSLFSNGANQGGYPVILGGGAYTPTMPYYVTRAGEGEWTVPQYLFQDLPVLVAPATQSAGVHLGIGLPWKGTLGGSYIRAGINNAFGDDAISGIDGVDVEDAEVWGANISLNPFKALGLTAEYAKSDMFVRHTTGGLGIGDSIFDDLDDELTQAWNAKGTLRLGKSLSLAAGWEEVQPFFAAPGDWGRIGNWKNPTNIEGFRGDVKWNLGKALTLSGFYGDYDSIVAGNGSTLDRNAATGILRESDTAELQTWGADAKLGTKMGSFSAGVEWVTTKPSADAYDTGEGGRIESDQSYINLGYGLKLSEATSLRLLYQIIEYKDSYLYGGDEAKGNVALGQFTVKF